MRAADPDRTGPSADRERLLAALPLSDHRMELAGLDTAVLVGGEGPPVVLLHGPGHSSLWWLRVVPRLMQSHRVVVPDLPGHGESAILDGRMDEELVLAWLESLIDRTCPVPPVLVGHALGGAIAARFAVEKGDRIQHLVLESSLGMGRFFPSPRFAFRLFRFFSQPSLKRQEAFFDHCMLDQRQVQRGLGDGWKAFSRYYVERIRIPDRKEAMQGLLKEVGLPKIPRRRLARIPVPVTLIHGRHDAAVRLRVAKAVSAEQGWPLHVLQAGADPDFEAPEEFLGALGPVLREAASAPSALRRQDHLAVRA